MGKHKDVNEWQRKKEIQITINKIIKTHGNFKKIVIENSSKRNKINFAFPNDLLLLKIELYMSTLNWIIFK